MKLKLRFVCEEGNFEFEVNTSRLSRSINHGFVGYKSATGNSSGYLELYHSRHGWSLVHTNGVYSIISNPMALDFDRVAYDIHETLARLNARPTPKKTTRKSHLTLVK